MTMPRPTGADPTGQPAQRPTPDEWELPDEATLNRLAGEFFSRLPGRGASAPSAAGSVPASAPQTTPYAAQPPPQPPSSQSAPSSSGQVPGGRLASVTVPQGASGLEDQPRNEPTTVGTSEPSELSGIPQGLPASLGQALSWIPSVPISDPTTGWGSLPASPELAGPHFYFIEERTRPGPRTRPAPRLREVPRLPGTLGSSAPVAPDPHPAFDVDAIRSDFPILGERIHGHPLVWFDNAATTQKPQSVIDRLSHFYAHENSNIHRAAHELAARATDAYEQARDTVARFIGASSGEEIIFVRGATEAINLVAQTWGRKHLHRGDEILISHLEHHANIVPWQMLAAESGAVIRVIPVDDRGQLLMGELTRLLSDRTRLVSVTQVSNALGTVTPVDDIVAEAHRAGACVLIDGAQSVPHTPIDLQSMGADFFVFSGHKIFGPTGIGVVYGRREVLEDMPPWQGGGNMITDVTLERSTYQPPPGRFEAGTGNIADAVGLGAALDYVQRIGMDRIAAYERSLVDYATAHLSQVRGLHLIGTAAHKASVVSFVLDGYEPLQVGKALNKQGIAVRAGHHCAQPILRRMGVEATVRPSFAFYNTFAEIDRMVAALHRLAADSGRWA